MHAYMHMLDGGDEDDNDGGEDGGSEIMPS